MIYGQSLFKKRLLMVLFILVVIVAAFWRPWKKRNESVPSYESIARHTGGEVFQFDPQGREGGFESANTARFLLAASFEPVMLRDQYAQQGVYEFPVDGSIKELFIKASGNKSHARVEVLRPNNISPSLELVQTHLHALIFEKPRPGKWKIAVNAAAPVTVAVKGHSQLILLKPSFVEYGGRLGHAGYFSRLKPLSPGDAALLRVELTSAAKVTAVGLQPEHSDQLISGSFVTSLSDERIVKFKIPGQAFRIEVTGEDRDGQPLQRTWGFLQDLHQPLEYLSFRFNSLRQPSEKECQFLSVLRVFSLVGSHTGNARAGCMTTLFEGKTRHSASLDVLVPHLFSLKNSREFRFEQSEPLHDLDSCQKFISFAQILEKRASVTISGSLATATYSISCATNHRGEKSPLIQMRLTIP